MAVQNSERKAAIRDRYKGVDPSLLEVIPATAPETVNVADRILNVAAYVRVSTENDEQTSSFELQQNDFTEQIKANPKWNFVGIYADEGISGTELSHRKGMLQMLEDCRAGKIDHILAKSIARFARNVVDCLSIIEELKNLNPPVGVYFEADNLYTLDATGSLVLTILATVAEEESRTKSVIMNWSIEKRFSRGIFLTPELLGYDRDENGDLIVNAEEAETVKVIYNLFINGWSLKELAELLTQYGRTTKLGNTEWNPSSIGGVILNERHCGDVLARKTYTPNFKNHIAKKNEGNRTQYIQRDHHEAIVDREVFNAAKHMMASRSYGSKNRPLPVLSVVDDGVLRGFVPVDKDWRGFSAEDYKSASESAYTEIAEQADDEIKRRHGVNMEGYQTVRGEFFPSLSAPAMTITKGKLRFNTACLKKFEDVEYVELLLNTVKGCVAIRPCEKESPNAIHWGKLREGRWCVNEVGSKGLSGLLFGMMSWDDDTKYKFRGQFICNGAEKMLLFELNEPEMIRTIERVVPLPESENDDSQQEEIVIREKVRVLPPSWLTTFGVPITSLGSVSLLERVAVNDEWEVLRPAKEVEELNILSADQLASLMKEAETIIAGWEKKQEGTTDDGECEQP